MALKIAERWFEIRRVDADITHGAPCRIVTGHEVDPAFVNRMQTVKERDQLTWHVVALEPGDHKTCIIAARRSWATEVRVLERHVTNDGEYKVRCRNIKKKAAARSRMLALRSSSANQSTAESR